jgi:hypothetical protein
MRKGQVYVCSTCWEYGYNTCDSSRVNSQGRKVEYQNPTSERHQKNSREVTCRHYRDYRYISLECSTLYRKLNLELEVLGRRFEH